MSVDDFTGRLCKCMHVYEVHGLRGGEGAGHWGACLAPGCVCTCTGFFPVLSPEKDAMYQRAHEAQIALSALAHLLCPACAAWAERQASPTPITVKLKGGGSFDARELDHDRFHDEECGRGDINHIWSGQCQARVVRQLMHDLELFRGAYLNPFNQPTSPDEVRALMRAMNLVPEGRFELVPTEELYGEKP